MGSIAVDLLIALAFLATMSVVNYTPVPFDLFTTTTPVYRIALYSTMMFMTINEFLIAPSIPSIGRWWEALFNLIVLSGLFALIVYYLPYQVGNFIILIFIYFIVEIRK